jgi:hypothetical protein
MTRINTENKTDGTLLASPVLIRKSGGFSVNRWLLAVAMATLLSPSSAHAQDSTTVRPTAAPSGTQNPMAPSALVRAELVRPQQSGARPTPSLQYYLHDMSRYAGWGGAIGGVGGVFYAAFLNVNGPMTDRVGWMAVDGAIGFATGVTAGEITFVARKLIGR